MAPCEMEREQLFQYLDGELPDRKKDKVESHLQACPSCQTALDNRRSFLEQISRAHPNVTAPPELRKKIEAILEHTSLAKERGPGFLTRFKSLMAGFQFTLTAPRLAFATVLLVVALAGVWFGRGVLGRPKSDFAVAALEAHQRHLRGDLPLGIRSSSPKAVSAWFQGRTPAHVNLPLNEDLPPQEQPYQLEGGGLVPYHGGNLAYISYRVGGRPVSLLAAPASTVTLAGHKQVTMKSLVIHYDSVGGFHVVTWAVPKKGITYALVSNASQHANQSCIVCHAGPRDREFMHALVSQ